MKTTLRKLLLLNSVVGKYLLMRLPEEPKIIKQRVATPVEEGDWFRDASHIVLNPNSFELGFVEEVFSRFLRTLA